MTDPHDSGIPEGRGPPGPLAASVPPKSSVHYPAMGVTEHQSSSSPGFRCQVSRYVPPMPGVNGSSGGRRSGHGNGPGAPPGLARNNASQQWFASQVREEQPRAGNGAGWAQPQTSAHPILHFRANCLEAAILARPPSSGSVTRTGGYSRWLVPSVATLILFRRMS